MEKEKNNLNENCVVANLVASYDLKPDDAKSVTSINYLCIYEYENKGKKYKYRTHQTDNFSSIPETIELDLRKNKIKSSYKIGIILWGILILSIFIYLIKNVINFDEINIPLFLTFIVLYNIIAISKIKSQNEKKRKLDEKLEYAILNNHTVNAYLVETKLHFFLSDGENNSYYNESVRKYPYSGKYTYSYNGKKYTKTFDFLRNPPTSIRLFFDKNPKDIFYFTE